MIFQPNASTRVRGSSVENSNLTMKAANLVGQVRGSQNKSMIESRQQQTIGEFLPRVETSASTGAKPKEKLNVTVTQYYTQNNNKLNDNSSSTQWMKSTGGGQSQGQRFMPYSSNASSVEAI